VEVSKEEIADDRRKALRKALADRDLTPTDLARLCGWAYPSKIYNFLNGVSQSVGVETYRQIEAALPGTTIQELMGEPPKPGAPPPVIVRTVCQGRKLRDEFSLPPHRCQELPLPVDDTARLAGAYAARVLRPGAEEIYPENSFLLCLPIAKFTGTLVKGRRVILQRFEGARFEITVREVVTDDDGHLWLSYRSTNPHLTQKVRLPENLQRPWQHEKERYQIAAVVIGAFSPETG
jgi:hypothetical protein